jgi:isopentenyl diphosphate isomerase/L-lactate dehydrogenase-like FMN-dependent dehydrogenase
VSNVAAAVENKVPVIADGGIASAGDIAKGHSRPARTA